MKKILIVEDNEVIVKGLKYLLTQENFEVKTCGSVNDAKNSISSEKFDLIILDITLPDGNGFELCKYIKAVNDTPVIFLTAKDEEKDVVKGLDIGADDYIVKPYEGFDFHDKFNGGLPPYQKVMYGKIIKETDKMYQLVARTADGFKIWAGWVPKKSMRIMS